MQCNLKWNYMIPIPSTLLCDMVWYASFNWYPLVYVVWVTFAYFVLDKLWRLVLFIHDTSWMRKAWSLWRLPRSHVCGTASCSVVAFSIARMFCHCIWIIYYYTHKMIEEEHTTKHNYSDLMWRMPFLRDMSSRCLIADSQLKRRTFTCRFVSLILPVIIAAQKKGIAYCITHQALPLCIFMALWYACLSCVYYTFDVCVYRTEYLTYLAHLRT